MKTYNIKKQKGIDDLLIEFAFKGNSQGDESVSNDVKEANNVWMSFCFRDVDKYNQDAINIEVIRRKKHNEDYIAKLKEEGKYGKEYKLHIHIKENPIFDIKTKSDELLLTSFKMLFINNEDYGHTK